VSAAPSLRLDSISFSFRDSLPILVDVSLDLHAGWTALIGPNGACKGTLLRALLDSVHLPRAGRDPSL